MKKSREKRSFSPFKVLEGLGNFFQEVSKWGSKGQRPLGYIRSSKYAT